MKKFSVILKTFLFISVALIAAASMAGQAHADTPFLQFDLDTEFSGGTEPSGTAPWLTATFDNNDTNDFDTTTVLLTMDSSSLTGTEGILDWYFNFDPNENSSNLTITYVSGAQASSINQGDDSWMANGDGKYDFQFLFNDEEFNPNMTSVYEVSYTSAITFNSFNFLSAPDGSPGVYGTAAQINDINGNNQGSGFIGASAGAIVPEPVSSSLFLVGAATLGFRRFWKRRKTA